MAGGSDKGMFFAHSVSSKDEDDWQALRVHLIEVSRLAAERGGCLGLSVAAGVAGLAHDLGKYDHRFQAYIRGRGNSIDHSTAGGATLLAMAGTAPERIAAEALAYCILGHHAGLPDRRKGGGGLDARCAQFTDKLDPVWRDEISLDLTGVAEELRGRVSPDPGRQAFDLSVAVRMLFSCLVEADFLDTEAFYAPFEGRRPDRDWPAMKDVSPVFRERFDAHMARLDGEGPLNILRRDILGHVRAGAALPPGLFTLTVPTGGGKTLASLGFALDHAAAHGHRRIIYAIPFTSIIDQTATIFRDVLGEGAVLEHHSAIDEEADTRPEGRNKLRLAMENWAAPVVVTTNVQLFESLFAARPSRARKLHNIAGSVIVLDEAQTLPRALLRPCLRMLDCLARHWGCSIVFCTATQPSVGEAVKGELTLDLRELAPDPVGLAERLRRARIVDGGEIDNAGLIAALAGVAQGFVIVNSRRHALELYREAKAAGLEGLVHLTTRQMAADRARVLADVRERLKDGTPCRLIATSLIEAGVDLDFPAGWRAKAGLDRDPSSRGKG
ncbi:MAG: CRISPR-associated endonuclease Cas3'' [Amaricoccus sp.]|uniref:CRISPR-associated endonuclease Cas3'' n=1 Tax=Amaricoccus sp. TaxID=1872485 RepID=UPI0039E365C9